MNDTDPLKVHLFDDVEAIRYGDINGEFDEGAPARIGQFVLGHDIDTRVTVLNERLTGVVMPDPKFWDPNNGVADLIVTDTKTGYRLSVGLGSWLVRDAKGRLRPMAHNKVVAEHFPQPDPKTFEEELETLLAEHQRDHNVPARIMAVYLSSVMREFNIAYSRSMARREERS